MKKAKIPMSHGTVSAAVTAEAQPQAAANDGNRAQAAGVPAASATPGRVEGAAGRAKTGKAADGQAPTAKCHRCRAKGKAPAIEGDDIEARERDYTAGAEEGVTPTDCRWETLGDCCVGKDDKCFRHFIKNDSSTALCLGPIFDEAASEKALRCAPVGKDGEPGGLPSKEISFKCRKDGETDYHTILYCEGDLEVLADRKRCPLCICLMTWPPGSLPGGGDTVRRHYYALSERNLLNMESKTRSWFGRNKPEMNHMTSRRVKFASKGMRMLIPILMDEMVLSLNSAPEPEPGPVTGGDAAGRQPKARRVPDFGSAAKRRPRIVS